MKNTVRLLTLLACAAAAALAGCARPAGTLFAPVFPPIVFPPPPDAGRIAYVGQLTTSADLKAAVSSWEAFTTALSGQKNERSISAPSGLAVTSSNKLALTDPPMRCLHIFDLEARSYRQVGSAGATPFAAPADVAAAEGKLFVSDAGRGSVSVFSESGDFQTTWSGIKFVRPVGMAYADDLHRIYVVDAGGHAVIGVSPDGAEQVRFGHRGSGEGELNFPTYVAYSPKLGVVVADSMNFRVQLFSPDGTYRGSFGKKGDGAGDFSLPKGVAVDPEQHIYVADANFENVQVFDPEGHLLFAFGSEGQKPGQFWLPAKIAIDARRRLWVADSYNRRVQMFRLMGEPSS